MKLLYLSPTFDKLAAGPEQMRPYLDALTDVIAYSLQPAGTECIIGVWHEGEGGMQAEAFTAEYAGKRMIYLTNPALLRAALRRTADPWDAYFMWIRCLTTCRWVHFGYDAQAYLCLRSEDVAPQPSALIQTGDVTRLLAEADVFDG